MPRENENGDDELFEASDLADSAHHSRRNVQNQKLGDKRLMSSSRLFPPFSSGGKSFIPEP